MYVFLQRSSEDCFEIGPGSPYLYESEGSDLSSGMDLVPEGSPRRDYACRSPVYFYAQLQAGHLILL